MRYWKRFANFSIGLAWVCIAACRKSEAPKTEPPKSELGDAGLAVSQPVLPAALATTRLSIPSGTFKAGTEPGTFGRKPTLEPRPSEVELGSFEIDPYLHLAPASQTALTSASQEQAAVMCAHAGGRLCTELEWERACKGPASTAFSTGAKWSETCAGSPRNCRNGFGVAGFGSFAEWTASYEKDPDSGARLAIVRAGASGGAERRCAHRSLRKAEIGNQDVAFRCCYGPPNAASVSRPRDLPAFRKLALPKEELTELLGKHERTRGLTGDVTFFREQDAVDTVISRGPGDRKGFDFTVSPLLWVPVPGAEFLLVSGRSGNSGSSGKQTSFVLAFYVLGEKRYQLAASFIMKNEAGPVVFAYSDYIRPRLHFSTCWGCLGETGKILYRNPDQVAILQP